MSRWVKVSTVDGAEVRRRAERSVDRGRSVHAARVDDPRAGLDLSVLSAQLEIQRREIERLVRELENERDRYFQLYDLAPVGYLTLDLEGHVRAANLTATAMLGMRRATLLGRSLASFVPADDRSRLEHHFAHVRRGMRHRSELVLRRPAGTRFRAVLESVEIPTATEHGVLVLTTVHDATDGLHAHQHPVGAPPAAREQTPYLETGSRRSRESSARVEPAGPPRRM